MRYLFDILHPAHVHVLRHTMTALKEHGHDVFVTARHKDVAVDLLERYGITHQVLSTQATSSLGLARELASRTYGLIRFARARRVDAMVGLMGPSIAPAAKLLRVPSFVLYDTEIASRTNSWVYPLATEVITPACYTAKVSGNHVTYNGYHELAYLHPNRFTPERANLASYGLDGAVPYAVVRLPSLTSSHDMNEQDTSARAWLEWIDKASRSHRIVISSERPLTAGLERYRLRGPIEDIHHVLAYADLVIGESATMAAEAAVLGTPATLVGATSRGYVDDIERRYGLIRYFPPNRFEDAAKESLAILDGSTHRSPEAAQHRLIEEHIDVTSWLTDHLVHAMTRNGVR